MEPQRRCTSRSAGEEGAEPQTPKKTPSQISSLWCDAMSSPGLQGEPHPVEADHHSPAQADVMLQAHGCPGNLPFARLSSELPAQLCTLGQTWGSRKGGRE